MITVDRESLIGALERCSGIAPQKTTLPIVSHALLVCEGGSLTYRATDLKSQIRGSIEAQGSGSFTVSPRSLASALSVLSGKIANLNPGSGFVQATGETKRSFKIETLSAGEFPDEIPGGEAGAEVPAELLGELVAMVFFAARHDGDRPEQMRVRVQHEEGKLVSVATNGHRAAVRRLASKAKMNLDIPLELARELKGLKDGVVTVSTSDRSMSFTIGSETLSALFPAGELGPVHAQVDMLLPGSTCRVNSEQLLDAVKAVQRVDSEHDTRLAFSAGKITVECSGRGSASDEVEADCTEPYSCWVDGSYLVDALSVVSGEVTVGYGLGDVDPLVLETEGWRYLVMPRRGTQVEARKGK